MRNIFAVILALFVVSQFAACASKTAATDSPAAKADSATGDPWFRAARTSDVAVLRGMVDGGKDINTSVRGLTALMVAARAGNPETIKWMLAHGADATKLDEDGQSALVYALVGLSTGLKREMIVEDLIKAGASPFKIDRLGFQPIQEMLELGMDTQIRKLTFTKKKACDLLPTPQGEVTLNRMARRMENIPMAEFLEAQGCW